MLKITRTETSAEEKWTLHGRLVGLWVSELRRCWKKTHRTDNKLKCIVDLNDVTLQFIASGIYIKHLLQERFER